ncbi:8.6 kDa transglutaminase substrate-like isoform X2 [Haemaphysalis longicornis]
MNAFTVMLLTVAIAIVGVSATSLPDCLPVPCDQSTCSPAECPCGTYKGHCGCCDICYKCANAECNSWILDECQENYECILDNPAEDFATGGVGHCRLHTNNTAQVSEHH